MSDAEKILIDDYFDISTRVYFILQLAYFKAKQQFFKFNFEDVIDDVKYIITHYYDNTNQKLSGCLSRYYLQHQKKKILIFLIIMTGHHNTEAKLNPMLVSS